MIGWRTNRELGRRSNSKPLKSRGPIRLRANEPAHASTALRPSRATAPGRQARARAPARDAGARDRAARGKGRLMAIADLARRAVSLGLDAAHEARLREHLIVRLGEDRQTVCLIVELPAPAEPRPAPGPLAELPVPDLWRRLTDVLSELQSRRAFGRTRGEVETRRGVSGSRSPALCGRKSSCCAPVKSPGRSPDHFLAPKNSS
jgi:hypothetical protein